MANRITSTPQSYSSLADGGHTFQVRATDGVGNVDPTPASFTWLVDTTAPDTTITNNPPAVTGANASFTFTGSDAGSGVASFQCKLDGASALTNTRRRDKVRLLNLASLGLFYILRD